MVGAEAGRETGVGCPGLAPGGVKVPAPKGVVRESDVCGVRRSARAVKEGGGGPQFDEPGWVQAILVADVGLVLARGVTQVGDGLAIRRPGGISFSGDRRPGQIAYIALLPRHGKDVAVCFRDHAHPGWRKREILVFFRGYLRETRRQRGQVSVVYVS